MATDFSQATYDAQQQGTTNDAVAALITDLAQQLAAVTPTTGAVQGFANDLANAANNLARACTQNDDGTTKPTGGDQRAPYLASPGT
jgi:hypothetical protein